MTSIFLDTEGRLHWFLGAPPQREPPGDERPDPDWSLPFREAGLDMANFQPVTSTQVPLHAYDTRAAWDGPDPSNPALKTHVEAAAFRGKLVYFETVYPWDQPVRQEVPAENRSSKALTFILLAVFIVALGGSALLALKNLRLGRGDRRGAARMALLYFTARMLLWLFFEHHNGLPEHEYQLLILRPAAGVFFAVFLWLLYVALEPFVRRRWPERIISWSRLLAGGFRDPLVGRDILIGAIVGVGMILSTMLAYVGPRWIGGPPGLVFSPGTIFIDAHLFLERFLAQLTAGLFDAFIALFLLLLFVVVLRRDRLAIVALWLFTTLVITLVTQVNVLMTPFVAVTTLLGVFTLYRFGLLAAVSAVFFFHLWVFFPITTELTAWYATDFVIALVICVALAVMGFTSAWRGNRCLVGSCLRIEFGAS